MAAPYEQRNPRNTLLYQLFEQHFDTFKEVYDQVFAEEYGYWRPVVEEVKPPRGGGGAGQQG